MKERPQGASKRPIKEYLDLSGHLWRLSSLSTSDRLLIEGLQKKVKAGTPWPELASYWRPKLRALYPQLRGPELVDLPVYRVCQDISSRAGIEQGYFRRRDYRDDLADLVTSKSGSRYRFSKQTGIDEAFLSRLLRKKAHVSIDTLESAIEPFGYRIALVRVEDPQRP